MLKRTHFPRSAGDARRAPTGPPCPPRDCAPRVHSGADAVAAGTRRKGHRVTYAPSTDTIYESPMVGWFSPRAGTDSPPAIRDVIFRRNGATGFSAYRSQSIFGI